VDREVVEQRIVEASVIVPASGGAIVGWPSLRWLGGRWFEGRDRNGLWLPISVNGVGIRAQPGIRVTTERLNSSEIICMDGLRIAGPLYSTLLEMRYAANLWEAVRVADMAAYSDLVSLDELRPFALASRNWTGIPQARAAIALADENSWSPMEVTLRLIWMLVAGLPRPLMNQPVFDLHGRHVGTPDLLDAETGTYGEFNGAFHLEGRRRRADQRREDALRAVGLEPFEVMSGQAHDEVASRMLAARHRAVRLAAPRRWTIEHPPWWIPTETVAQRRSLTASDRVRLLRHRAA
jgi:hypothetical protein